VNAPQHRGLAENELQAAEPSRYSQPYSLRERLGDVLIHNGVVLTNGRNVSPVVPSAACPRAHLTSHEVICDRPKGNQPHVEAPIERPSPRVREIGDPNDAAAVQGAAGLAL